MMKELPAMRPQHRLTDRYRHLRGCVFAASVAADHRTGASILDVGSGRTPALENDERPPGCGDVGETISTGKLGRALPGDYDERIIADRAQPLTALHKELDLILSWWVLDRPPGPVFPTCHDHW